MFKKRTIPVFFFMAAFPLLFAFTIKLQQPSAGQKIFASKCVKCHGADGTKEKVGAKNLHTSKLGDADILAMIEEGKKIMPSYKKKLTPDEIKAVADYVKTLRK